MSQTKKTLVNSEYSHFLDYGHGKIPPQAVDIEEVVLGAIMIEPVIEKVDFLTPDVFYKSAHQLIFSAILSIYKKLTPIDILTVTEELRKNGNIDLVGGPHYITILTNKVSSSANIEFHAKILYQKYVARKLIEVCSKTIENAYNNEFNDIFDLISNIDRSLQSLTNITSKNGMINIEKLVDKAEEEAKKRELLVKEGKFIGIPTGFHELNKVTKGWQPGDLIILASRPSMGKTSLAVYFTKIAALSGFNVNLFELEMSSVSLANKLILSECDISQSNFKSGYMSSKDWTEFNKAKYNLSKLPIYVDDNPVVNLQYVRSVSRFMKKNNNCDMIILDYLQLVDMKMDEKNRNREQEVAQASRLSKLLAKEVNVPVILLSQLSRAVETRGGDKRPILSDLRESGALEQDADIVIFVYRAAYYNKKDETGEDIEGIGELLIAKHRNGPLKDIIFRHNEPMTRFYDYKKDEDLPF